MWVFIFMPGYNIRFIQYLDIRSNIEFQRLSIIMNQQSIDQKLQQFSHQNLNQHLEDKNHLQLIHPSRQTEYLLHFSKTKQQISSIRNHLLANLPSSITYDQNLQFADKLIIKVNQWTKNYQIIRIQAQMGYFKFKDISIFTIDKPSPSHESLRSNRGNFGSVFKCSYQNKRLAFKCCVYNKTDSQGDSTIYKVIEEYCMLKLASYLQAGPNIQRYLGFDIICYFGCIQFYMEECLSVNQQSQRQARIKIDLNQSLIKLHSIRLIHHDIKMDNICFSPIFNKFIFIDFGMSRIIRQYIGIKTLSNYRGTVQHCSDQMLQVFRLDKLGLVDLYYNDLIGLKKTLVEIQKAINLQNQQEIDELSWLDQIKQVDLTLTLRILPIKFNIFSNCIAGQEVKRLTVSQVQQLIRFIPSLIRTPGIKQIQLALRKIIKYNNVKNEQIIDENKINNQSVYPVRNIINQLYQINKHSIVHYLYHSQHPTSTNIIALLRDQNVLFHLKKEDFLLLLALAIKINSSQLSLKDLELFCEEKILYLQQLCNQTSQLIQQHQYTNFIKANKILLKQAIKNQFTGQYFQLYSSVIANVVILQIIDQTEIVQCYESMLKLEMGFGYKLQGVLLLREAIGWIGLISESRGLKCKLRLQIVEVGNKFLQQCRNNEIYSQIQIQLFRIVMIELSSYRHSSQNQYLAVINKQLLYRIKLWSQSKNICLFFDNNNTCQVDWQQTIQIMVRQDVTYYHYFICLYYIFQSSIQRCEAYLSRSKNKLNRFYPNNMFMRLVQQSISIRKCNYKQMNDYFGFCKDIINKQNKLCINIIKTQLLLLVTIKKELYIQLNKQNQIYIIYYLIKTMTYLYQFIQNQCVQLSIINYYHLAIQISHIYYISSLINYPIHQTHSFTHLHTISSQNNTIFSSQNYTQNQYNQILFSKLFCINTYLFINQQYHQALKLSKYLSHLSQYSSYKFINKVVIFEYISCHTIRQMQKKGNNHIRRENKQIYFQYLDEIIKTQSQQKLFTNYVYFVDVVQLLFQYQPQSIIQIINRVSKKLLTLSTKQNCMNYIHAFDNIHHRIRGKHQNISLTLYNQLHLFNNPYNLIPKCCLIHCVGNLNLSPTILRKHLILSFQGLNILNPSIRDYLLKQLFLIYYVAFSQKNNLRKNQYIFKKYIRVGWVDLNSEGLQKFLIKSKTLKINKSLISHKNLALIIWQLQKWLPYIQSNNSKISVKIHYGHIKFIRKRQKSAFL